MRSRKEKVKTAIKESIKIGVIVFLVIVFICFVVSNISGLSFVWDFWFIAAGPLSVSSAIGEFVLHTGHPRAIFWIIPVLSATITILPPIFLAKYWLLSWKLVLVVIWAAIFVFALLKALLKGRQR